MKAGVIIQGLLYGVMLVLMTNAKPPGIVDTDENTDNPTEGYIENEVEGNEIVEKEEELLERGAIYGHSSIAANPHIKPQSHQHNHEHYPQGSPSLHYQQVSQPPPHQEYVPLSQGHRDDMYPARPSINYQYGDKSPAFQNNYERGDDLKEALEHIDYIRWLVMGHRRYMQMSGCSYNIKDPNEHMAQSCEPTIWNKCNCMSPATYSDQGRGNCNLGATRADLKVWCYVDDSNGDPATVCPDSKISKSKPGYYWSRFACIT